MKNCYIHIPFCKSICSYCDFCKMFYNEKIVDKYLEELEKEIISNYKGEVLETIYIGGGTPSSLSIKQLDKLFSIISTLKRSSNCEVTMEANFDSIDEDKLILLKDKGVNRLSFGIETVQDKFYKLIERYNNKEDIIKKIKLCRRLGFNNINVDLMYAFKNEEIDDLNKDLDFIFSLDVEHISTYSLIIEENTKLYIKGIKNINEDIDASMYNLICKRMSEFNYKHYEISNFSKDGYSSKHNLCYWNNSHYYGFGLGASSYIGNKRINNTRSISKYLDGKHIKDYEELSLEDEIYYFIILGLRKSSGLNLDLFKKTYGSELSDYYKYDDLVHDNFIKNVKRRLFISEDMWYVSNEIIVRLLEGEVEDE